MCVILALSVGKYDVLDTTVAIVFPFLLGDCCLRICQLFAHFGKQYFNYRRTSPNSGSLGPEGARNLENSHISEMYSIPNSWAESHSVCHFHCYR